MTIRLDLHVHSQRSADGCMSISEIVAQARKRGLQGIAVCDHDIALETVPQYDDFLIIPGIEVSTDRGHVLGLFITEQISTNQMDEAVHSIHAQGGLAVIAHPFEHSQDIHRLDDVIEQFDGIEVWNGRADRKNRQANAMALELAKHWNKPVTAGSDAHVSEEIEMVLLYWKLMHCIWNRFSRHCSKVQIKYKENADALCVLQRASCKREEKQKRMHLRMENGHYLPQNASRKIV